MPSSSVQYFSSSQPFVPMPCWYNPNIIATATTKFGKKEYFYENKFGIYKMNKFGNQIYYVKY